MKLLLRILFFLVILNLINICFAYDEKTVVAKELKKGENPINEGETHVGKSSKGEAVTVKNMKGQANVGEDGAMSSGRFEGGEGGGTVEVGEEKFTLSPGQSVTYENGKWTVSPKVDEINTQVPPQRPRQTPGATSPQPTTGRTQPATFRGFSEGTISPEGNYEAQGIEKVEQGDFTIQNAQNIKYVDGVFTIEKADRIEIKDGILTQVSQFKGTEIEFHVGSTKDAAAHLPIAP